MPNLKEVKNRISSVVSTQQITKAMKMVAAAKLRKSQDRILQMRPFAQKLDFLLSNLSSAQSNEQTSWYNAQRESSKILIVVVSSDRGLCGSFNSNILKTVSKLLLEDYKEQHAKGNVTILPLGKKVNEFFSKRKVKVDSRYWSVFSRLTFEETSIIASQIMEAFENKEFDKVVLVYNEFKNVATQVLRTEQYLPILPEAQTQESSNVDYIYQPNREEIVNGLVPKSLKVKLFKALLESNAAENGARMTAMDKATENAGELLKELRLSYNRTRQAAITKEILEIVAGAEALKG
ncbi:MAG TPA: ATP synthase F1 subunit gamma [Cyclobacteriaceae bacterium]|nr:ATP synthase F1 subunit gamma [Cyclobacteriaceae bacterium]